MTLVLGGARSGKSAVAERLCQDGATPVVYIATAAVSDPDMAERVAAHRARRPADWTTVEAGSDQVVAAVGSAPGRSTILLDALTTWVAAAPDFAVDGNGLCAALRDRAGDAVVVSDEVGLGVHPSTEAGRRFRDRLGLLNQVVAAASDQVLLVVAGRVLPLEAGPERPSEREAGPERPSERGPGPERPPERGPGPERPPERGTEP